VGWLTAQAIVFGAWAALLGVVANAMFLAAFGAGWLPVTYIAIGIAGVAVSAAIRQGAQRLDLLGLAVFVLGGASGLIAIAWIVATRGAGAWVSGPLLVAFPILIQLGFVFIGGQAGRALDIAGIKTNFPRILAGFPVGATIGGLGAVPLVNAFGRVEDLLLVTAGFEAAFAALVWATGRRHGQLLRMPAPATGARATGARVTDSNEDEAPFSIRTLLGRPLVVLLLAYQLLSALGSQVADFLVFDRASALYPGAEDLGRFVAIYTAVMNGIAIAFLAVLAGPLLRRYGLRLGIGANPIIDLVLVAVVLGVLVASGPASIAMLGVVSATRIADIVLTDGMTRTAINALYQVLPLSQRLIAQATVEGMGIPVAIGLSGVLILLLDALPGALALRVAVLAVVCAAWTWVAARLYGEYGPALAAALRGRRLLEVDTRIDASLEDMVLLGTLAAGEDRESVQLARELAGLVPSSLPPPMAAPQGPRSLPARDVPTLRRLLDDSAPEVRRAALEATGRGDAFALGAALRGLRDSRTARAASLTIDRLGDAAVPALSEALDAARVEAEAKEVGVEAEATTMARRLLRAMATSSRARDTVLWSNVNHPDRSIDLAVMARLASAGPAPAEVIDRLVRGRRDDVEHAMQVLSVLVALRLDSSLDRDGVVARAIREELELLAHRIAARLELRHGRDELGPALARLRRDAGEAALAAESLEVALGRDGASEVLALLTPGLDPEARLRRLRPESGRDTGRAFVRSAAEWLRDMVDDRDGVWRSSWLRGCAIRAASGDGRSA
jgi:hypothetical protein